MRDRLLRLAGAGLAAAMMLLTAACNQNPENRELEFMPDMYRSPAVEPQEYYPFFENKLGSRVPPAGTVPRGFQPNRIAWNELEKSDKLRNPLPVNEETLRTGKKYFTIYCMTCHNYNGNGAVPVTGFSYTDRSYVAGRMPIPPVLYSDKIRKEWTDGRIYHVITHGQGNMPAYAYNIEPEVRWAIVHWVRVIGLAASPSEADVAAFEKLGVSLQADDPRRPVESAENPFPER